MDADSDVPPGVDPTVPSVGRMYDYVLNGRYHLPVDAEAVERLREMVPEIYYTMPANRAFLQHTATPAGANFRTREEIDRFFDGLEYLLPYPGAEAALSYCDRWGSKKPSEVDPAHTWLPAGVARKP